MTHATRRLRIAALCLVALAAAACGPATSSATPSSPASASPVPTSSPSVPATTPSAIPSATSVASSSTAACAAMPQTADMPSDRFTDLKVTPGPTADRLTFVFGKPSLSSPAGPPSGTLDVASPPYTQAGSGAAITMTGHRVVAIRFSGMSLQNDAAEETYSGPTDLRPNLPALRDAVLYDASEGVVGWYVGYDGSGCVTLGRDGDTVTVSIDHS
jgi:ABC-type phosphate transport system substrate-binding protein